MVPCQCPPLSRGPFQPSGLTRCPLPRRCIPTIPTLFPASASCPCPPWSRGHHRRWRIEEAFKRLKHRLNLEHVSGLSPQAVAQDVAAKVLCDNLQALTTQSAYDKAHLPESTRINRAYVHSVLKPLLPALLLGKAVAKLLRAALALLAKHTCVHRANLSKPRKPGPKPHRFMTQKHC